MRRRRDRRNRAPHRLAPPPPPSDDYAFALRDRYYTFSPRNGMVFFTLGLTDEKYEARIKDVRARGRDFETEAEVNAYAAEHGWPNWRPLSAD